MRLTRNLCVFVFDIFNESKQIHHVIAKICSNKKLILYFISTKRIDESKQAIKYIINQNNRIPLWQEDQTIKHALNIYIF